MLKKIAHVAYPPAVLAEMKNEPMVFSADIEFAHANTGPITRGVIDKLMSQNVFGGEEDNVVIDTRVHMLKPGWVPAIGGWHCDAIPRGPDGQPDFNDPVIPTIRHYLVVVDDGTGSLTDFIDLPATFQATLPTVAPEGENLWGNHSKAINYWSKTLGWKPTTCESGGIYEFDARDYHTAVPATGHGWRYFFRASVNTKTRGPLNEIRKQVQVYLPDADMGW